MGRAITKEEYLKAKQIVSEYEEAQNTFPKIRRSWECNQCGSKEWSDVVSEIEIDSGLLACSGCGGDEFHLVDDEP